MNQSRRESTHAGHAPIRGRCAPAIEGFGAAELVVDLCPQVLRVEESTQIFIAARQYTFLERTDAFHLRKRLAQQSMLIASDRFAGLHQQIDDLFERHVERGTGLSPRPYQGVDIQRGRRKRQ